MGHCEVLLLLLLPEVSERYLEQKMVTRENKIRKSDRKVVMDRRPIRLFHEKLRFSLAKSS